MVQLAGEQALSLQAFLKAAQLPVTLDAGRINAALIKVKDHNENQLSRRCSNQTRQGAADVPPGPEQEHGGQGVTQDYGDGTRNPAADEAAKNDRYGIDCVRCVVADCAGKADPQSYCSACQKNTVWTRNHAEF